jgi:putative flippase GtrA
MWSLVVRYALFAAIATAVNLLTQRAVLFLIAGNLGLPLAILAGTATGLVVKYALDKKWIFRDPSTGLASHGRKFGLYALMGIATTVIFWSMETAFWWLWHTETAREAGAVIGLTIGYVVKYRLDRRFVFEPRTSEA